MPKQAPPDDREGKEVEAKPKKRAREILTSMEVPSYYCNTLDMMVSKMDFRLRICEVLEAPPEKLTAKHVATIYFSPVHMKEVARLLQKHVDEYEKKHGKIPG